MSLPVNPTRQQSPYGVQAVQRFVGPEAGPVVSDAPLSIQLMASASRTVTTQSNSFNNYGYRGALFNVVVTVNPGGAQTLEFIFEGLDGNNLQPFTILDVPASAAPGGWYMLYPGASGAPVEGVGLTRNLILPGLVRVRAVHSGAGAWTYSVGGWFLP